MAKIRMEIKISNGEDNHVMKFDEEYLQILIDALHDYRCDDCERILSNEISGALTYFYDCLKEDDGGGDYE